MKACVCVCMRGCIPACLCVVQAYVYEGGTFMNVRRIGVDLGYFLSFLHLIF